MPPSLSLPTYLEVAAYEVCKQSLCSCATDTSPASIQPTGRRPTGPSALLRCMPHDNDYNRNIIRDVHSIVV